MDKPTFNVVLQSAQSGAYTSWAKHLCSLQLVATVTVEPHLTDMHPSTVDTCNNITDYFEYPDRISKDFKHLNNRHPAIPCNGHLPWSRLSLRNSK